MTYEWIPPSKKHQPRWPGKLVESIPLENGLVLEIWNYSRRLAGDRWLVGMLAQIGVEAPPEAFSRRELYEVFLEEEEGRVYYRYRKERTFVDEREKEALFEELKNRFLEVAVGYLSHPSFRERLIAAEVALYERKKTWEEEIRRRDEELDRLEEEWKDRPI
ncbi:MAG: hypothetical protein GXO20_05940 [Thermodesulfobacteria bacterium]|nr:hypothetical protein [Thermodesulfobacteriota bacterium]